MRRSINWLIRACSAIAFLGQLLTPAQSGAVDSSADNAVELYLDAIDSHSYMDLRVQPADGPPGVEFFTINSPEIKYLIAHSNIAIPQMLVRFGGMNDQFNALLKRVNGDPGRITQDMLVHFESASPIHNSSTLIAYFIIFKYSKDARVMEALADYLDSIPPLGEATIREQAGSKDLAYGYAWEASCVFVDCSSLNKTYAGSRQVEGGRELAARLRAAASASSNTSR